MSVYHVRVGAVWHLQVLDVARDSPFARMGLEAGDTITSFDGHPLHQVTDIHGFFTVVARATTLTVVDAEGNEQVVTTTGAVEPD